MTISPEIENLKAYDSRTDVWSLGVTLFYMCSFHLPKQTRRKSCKDSDIYFESGFPAIYSKELQNFIMKMLEKDKSKRPFIAEIVRSLPEKY